MLLILIIDGTSQALGTVCNQVEPTEYETRYLTHSKCVGLICSHNRPCSGPSAPARLVVDTRMLPNGTPSLFLSPTGGEMNACETLRLLYPNQHDTIQ